MPLSRSAYKLIYMFACSIKHVTLFLSLLMPVSAFSCMLPAAPPPDKSASVFLTTPTKVDLESGTATFMCLAKEFSPEKHTFKWLQDDVVVKEVVADEFLAMKKTNVTLYTATSVLQLKADIWKKHGTKITCTFEHEAGNETKDASNTGVFYFDIREQFNLNVP